MSAIAAFTPIVPRSINAKKAAVAFFGFRPRRNVPWPSVSAAVHTPESRPAAKRATGSGDSRPTLRASDTVTICASSSRIADDDYGAGTAAFVRAFQAEIGDASNVARTANAAGHYTRLGVLQSMGSRYDDPASDRADISDPSMTPQKTIDTLGNLIHNTYDGDPGFTIGAVHSEDSGFSRLLGGFDANPYVITIGLGGDYDTSANKALITGTASHYGFDDNGRTHVHVGDGNFHG